MNKSTKTKEDDAIMLKIQKHNAILVKLWHQWKQLVWGKGAV